MVQGNIEDRDALDFFERVEHLCLDASRRIIARDGPHAIAIMQDLGFDLNGALLWFPHERDQPYVLVRVADGVAKGWARALGAAVRRCYITDATVAERAQMLDVPRSAIVAATLPPPGAVMAGDFGEIVVYFYLATKEHPQIVIGPKKWRLKQDRSKPAPYSDVLHFVLPSWPVASDQDRLICSEVKTKSTPGPFAPIKAAIEDIARDRMSRLTRTLMWLRDRALVEDLGVVTLQHLNRLINATEHPAYSREFRAVAVVCSSLLDSELAHAPREAAGDYSLVVIAVPELHAVYRSVFEAAARAAFEGDLAEEIRA